MVGVGCCFAIFPCWEGTYSGWRGKGQDRSCVIKLGAVLRGHPDGWTARGRRAMLIPGLLHIWKFGLLVLITRVIGIEVVEHRQDPAISTRAVFDAVCLVCGD